MVQPSPNIEKDVPGVIAPPPLIYLGGLVLGLLVDYGVGGPSLGALSGVPAEWRYVLGAALVVLGVLLAFLAAKRFRDAGTEVIPYRPSTALVTSGAFRFTRNPMYVGMTCAYLGLALLADSIIGLLFLLPVLAVMTYGVILREEHYLEVKFGEAYRDYKRKVRRWI